MADSTCGKVKDGLDQAWEWYKRRSHVVLIVASLALALFGLFFIAGGIYLAVSELTPPNIGAAAASGAVGALMLLSAVLGAVVVWYPRRPLVAFLYTVYMVLLFVAELVLLVYLLTIVQKIGTLYSTPYSANLTDATTRSVSDFTYSLYTTCCTGCTLDVCGAALNGTSFCDQSGSPPQCQWVYQCSTPIGLSSHACFLSTTPAGTTPPWSISSEMCSLLQQAGWGATNKPIVGDIGVDSSGVASCGGGNPLTFALSVSDFLSQQYTWVSAIVGIVLFVELLVATAGWAATRHALDLSKDGERPRDQLRPWAST